jgi:Phosphopantetheine attachment site
MSRVQEEFGVKLLLRAVFDHPTVAALAEAIDAVAPATATAVEPAPSPIRRAARRATEFER